MSSIRLASRPTPRRRLVALALSALVCAAIGFAPSVQAAPGPVLTPATSVVQLNFHGSLVERKAPFDWFGRSRISLALRLKQLRKAADDPQVGAIVLRFGSVSLTFAQAQELSGALARCRKAQKKIYAYLDQGGNVSYLLAANADVIALAPSGMLMINGLRLEAIFLKDLLAKIGVEAEFEATGKYKSAADSLTRSTMSEAQREALNLLLDDVFGYYVGHVAKRRGLSEEKVKAAIDLGLLNASSALANKLVDKLMYWEEFRDFVAKQHSGGWLRKYATKPLQLPTSIFSLFSFFSQKPRQVSGPHVAVLYATGPIVYASNGDDFGGDEMIGALRMLKTLRRIEANPDVKALVLRVDSPGGSALASDLIYVALSKLKKRIPVIVSMGSVAASGGYYISVAADTIVAQPTTITGSIGVIGGKLIVKGLFGKIGVNSVVLTRGKNANIFGANRGFNSSERAQFRHFIEQTYADFLSKVARGRKLPLEKVRQLAQGRIWSGKQAFKHNLVDHLGGLDYALRLARLKAKLPENAPIVAYPKQKSLFEYLKESTEQEMRLGLRLLVPLLARALPGLPLTLLRSALGTVRLLRDSPMLMHLGYRLRLQ